MHVQGNLFTSGALGIEAGMLVPSRVASETRMVPRRGYLERALEGFLSFCEKKLQRSSRKRVDATPLWKLCTSYVSSRLNLLDVGDGELALDPWLSWRGSRSESLLFERSLVRARYVQPTPYVRTSL